MPDHTKQYFFKDIVNEWFKEGENYGIYDR